MALKKRPVVGAKRPVIGTKRPGPAAGNRRVVNGQGGNRLVTDAKGNKLTYRDGKTGKTWDYRTSSFVKPPLRSEVASRKPMRKRPAR